MEFYWDPGKSQENILLNLRAAIRMAASALPSEFQSRAVVTLEEMHVK